MSCQLCADARVSLNAFANVYDRRDLRRLALHLSFNIARSTSRRQIKKPKLLYPTSDRTAQHTISNHNSCCRCHRSPRMAWKLGRRYENTQSCCSSCVLCRSGRQLPWPKECIEGEHRRTEESSDRAARRPLDSQTGRVSPCQRKFRKRQS